MSIKKVSSAAIAAAESERAIGEIYNLSADEFGTMREAYEDLIANAGTGASASSLPRSPTKFGMWVLDMLDLSQLITFHTRV